MELLTTIEGYNILFEAQKKDHLGFFNIQS